MEIDIMDTMTDRCMAVLRKSRPFLVRDLDVDLMVDHLVSDMILGEEDEECINAEQVRQKKVRKLMEILPRKGPKAYTKFIEVLKKNQVFLREEVRKIEILSDKELFYEPKLAQYSVFAREEARLGHGYVSGVVTQPTDDYFMQPVEDVKAFMEDVEANMSENIIEAKPEAEPIDIDEFGLPPVCLAITGPDEGQRIDPMRTTPRNPNIIVSQKALSTLASNLGAEWEPLAISMGFSQNKLYQFKENSKSSVWGQIFAFLTAWSSTHGYDATIELLINELRSFKSPGVAPGAYRHLYFE